MIRPSSQQIPPYELADPHAYLGAHPAEGGVVIRAYRPGALSVRVLPMGVELERLGDDGVFEGTVEGAELPLDYELEVGYPAGDSYVLRDPYAFLPTVGELDVHLASEGRHEELYFVAKGHAIFVVDGEEVDAPAGTFVFVSDPNVRRGAFGLEHGTTVLVLGGVPGRAFQASPWEAWLEATPHLDAGEPERGIEVFERTLAIYPGNPNVLYNLACFEALAGRTDDALAHLAEAVEGDPRTREWAQTDSDFDAIRSDPRFPAAG